VRKMSIIIILFIVELDLNAQPKKIENAENVVSEADFYLEDGVLLSDAIVVKFKEKVVISEDRDKSYFQRIDEKYQTTLNALKELEKKAGKITLDKSIKGADPNDLTRTNKRTGESVTIKDLSQLYHLRFENPVSVTEVVKQLKDLPEVEYVHQPVTIVYNYTPNDPLYTSPGQWNLNVVQAASTWNITTGSSSIDIGLVDCGVNYSHEDLQGKYNWTDGNITGDHGTAVAGIAGVNTNNSIGIAGLGFNIRLNSYNPASSSVADAIDMCARYSDIINMSFGTFRYVTEEELDELGCPWPEIWDSTFMPYSYPEIAAEVANAITEGIVCIASAGNNSVNDVFHLRDPEECDCSRIPFNNYPAAYSDVIAISATAFDDTEELFVDIWNYGSFVDVSAPGWDIPTTNYSGGYRSVYGTSFSSPLTAALCGLLLSMNSSLTVQQVTNYIINSTDKVDATNHPYNGSGWNQYLGYGRINAYKAVQPPSAPLNLSYTNVSGHPRLSWSASDWDVKLYEIWRDLGSGFVKIAEVTAPTTTYTDNELLISSLNPYNAWYYVKAKDLTNQTSTASTSLRVCYYGLAKGASIEIVQTQLPTDPTLYQNFPNPCNPTTLIQFSIPDEQFVSIKLYNGLGQEVSTVVSGVKPAGLYKINFDASNLSTGLYLCTMKTASTVITQKMIVCK